MIDSAAGPKYYVHISEVSIVSYHRIIDEVVEKAIQEPKLEVNDN
jgi:hypothetical protein